MHQDMQFKFFIFFVLFFGFIFFIPSIQAREPLAPRFSTAAYTGVYTVGQADLMVSLDGDSQHNLYVDPQGAYGSDQQWYGDLGLGYRWIKNDAAILGGYLFAGHSRVENTSGFWIVNPGIEALGSRWDARINAYIPVAGRSNEIGNVDFNIVSEPFFTGHTEVINSEFNVANAIQQIGNGADARVGYQFFHQVPLKGYVGTYFFAIPNTNNILGGAAGLEYWFDDNIRVFANYSYDNYQRSNVVGGLGISFGGVRKHWADPSLSERLTDPVDRYLANLGHGSGIPSKTLLYGMGSGSSTQLISNSIAFFSQTGMPNDGGVTLTPADCTFEAPCGPTVFSSLGVDTLNNFLPNTMFYFNGGTYPASNGSLGPIELNNGQSVFSRTADYSAPATGAARSTFNGAFLLLGNNQLDGVILNNSRGFNEGITSNAGPIVITNTDVGSASNRFNVGISLNNTAEATLNNVFVFGVATGISVTNGSLSLESTQVNSINPSTAGAQGIALNNSNLDMNLSTVFASTSGMINTNPDQGIVAANMSTATINNSTITVGNGIDNGGTQRGIDTSVGGANSSVTMNLGSITVANSTGNTSAARLTFGPNISLDLVSCTRNGAPVPC